MEQTQATCERCGRAVDPNRLWTLTLNIPPDGRVERAICVVCAADVRRYLLAQPGSRYVAAASVDEDAEPSGVARFGWFLVRGIVYGSIAVALFILVTLLTSR
jgi:hypothetical protein